MLMNDDGRVTYQRRTELKITKRTVSFGQTVYQFSNITGFSDGEIKPAKFLLIVSLCFVSFFVLSGIALIEGKFIPQALISFGLAGISLVAAYNSTKKKYGLLLTLNSGDRHLFITSDKDRMQSVIDELHLFMDSDRDGRYVVTIHDNSLTILGNMTGGVAAVGNQRSTVTNYSR